MENTNQIPKTGIAGLKAHFKDDFVAGLIVSLIALPLCLGIASASGVPPLAGIVTAIIGGIIGSRIAGSYVTISGPAAGLIVITLGAAESMGGAGIETGFAGYPHALGAIVIGGLIMAGFGLLKVGKVGDYFPSAAVHGMLAAIGVIIMIKLLFPALGVAKPKGEILEVATEIPHAFIHMNQYAAIISAVTLATLILHPFINNKIIKIIPAPMWVLIFTIPLASYLGGKENLDMVNLDGGLLGGGGLKLPSFEKIATSAFWVAVVGVALVSAIESLLSAKAVDTLDPYKRKSDLDKDLIAMGAGSSVAAAVGGLPMISEIVRSSANVNNGAKTQWANFFHGMFLLIYVIIGVSVIEMIPNAALAAMLVFTGFKLAHPKEFKHMAEIGKTEIIVFVITLLAVLATDLIIGIVVGIIFTYIFIIAKGNPFGNLFKAQAEIKLNTLKLSGYLTFSNYLSLKKKMDEVLEQNDEIILDFANVEYIDHTVSHHLEDYERNAVLAGKKVKLINMEGLVPETGHPLAARSRNGEKFIPNTTQLSKRTQEIKEYADKNKYEFIPNICEFDEWEFYHLTIRRKIESIENIVVDKENRVTYEIADITTKIGALTTEDYDQVTAVKISGINNVPKFFIEKAGFIDKLEEKLFEDDIDFNEHPIFSEKYVVRADGQEAETRAFLNSYIIDLLTEQKEVYLSGNGKDLLLHFRDEFLSVQEMEQLLKLAKKIVDKI